MVFCYCVSEGSSLSGIGNERESLLTRRLPAIRRNSESERVCHLAKLLPYFRWYPADAESDAKYAAMTLSELGLFHRCLNHAWLNDGLSSSVEEMSRELRISEKEIRPLWSRVSKCFVPSAVDDRVRNNRQEEERSHAVSKSSKSSDAANVKHRKHADAVRTHNGRSADVVSCAVPRAYGSVSESVFESSEEKRKGRVGEVLIIGLEVKEMERAHERHMKQRAGHTLQLAAQTVIGLNGKFDLVRFRDRHPRYCAYWDRKDWQFCPLTLCEWLENGMPEPPPDAVDSEQAKLRRLAGEE